MIAALNLIPLALLALAAWAVWKKSRAGLIGVDLQRLGLHQNDGPATGQMVGTREDLGRLGLAVRVERPPLRDHFPIGRIVQNALGSRLDRIGLI